MKTKTARKHDYLPKTGDGAALHAAPGSAKCLADHVADRGWHPALSGALVWMWGKPKERQKELEPLFLELSAKLYDLDAAAARAGINPQKTISRGMAMTAIFQPETKIL